jgi:hypothetical protein
MSSSAFWGSTSEDGGKRSLTYLEIGDRQLRGPEIRPGEAQI